MAANVQQYTEMADCATVQITSDIRRWASFLRLSGRMYKYPFQDQVLIHAQRPRATACAEYDVWDRRMRRYVRRGSKGIALLRSRNNKPAVTYIFDLADTGAKQDSAPVLIWQYNDLYADTVTAHLKKVFGVSGNKGVTEQLIRIALQLSDTYWNDNKHAIISAMKDSLMEELDELNIGIRFRNSAAVSIAFVLLSRCGLNMTGYFTREDFQYLNEFNSKSAAAMLGTAVRDCSELVLRQIERAIKAHQNRDRPRKPTQAAFPDLSRPAVTSEQNKEQATTGVEDTQVSSAPVAVSEPVIQPAEKEKAPAEPTAATLPKCPQRIFSSLRPCLFPSRLRIFTLLMTTSA